MSDLKNVLFSVVLLATLLATASADMFEPSPRLQLYDSFSSGILSAPFVQSLEDLLRDSYGIIVSGATTYLSIYAGACGEYVVDTDAAAVSAGYSWWAPGSPTFTSIYDLSAGVVECPPARVGIVWTDRYGPTVSGDFRAGAMPLGTAGSVVMITPGQYADEATEGQSSLALGNRQP